jgi:DNA-directed RNA polymerase subunit RPC12/RpoP
VTFEASAVPGDFRCGHCEAEFATEEELDEHRWSAHQETPPPGLRCPTCGAACPSVAALDAHVREAHELMEDVESEAPTTDWARER